MLTAEALGPPVEEWWQGVFATRAGAHVGVRPVDLTRADPHVVAALAPSLAVFQLGESGDGAHLLDAAAHAGTGPAYREALAAFVVEEHEHARLLALVLDAAGAPLRSRHWSDQLFVVIRRARSLRTEVLVLLVAEVVALTYYAMLRDAAGLGDACEVFGRIRADEVVHVDFHCETLPRHLATLRRPARVLAAWGWRGLVTGAAVAVALDHGRALRAVGASRRRFLRRVGHDRDAVARRLFATPR